VPANRAGSQPDHDTRGRQGAAAFVCVALLLSGCAEPYWIKAREPMPVHRIVEVERPCGLSGVDGCCDLAAGVIYLRSGMPADLRSCVLSHERKHFAGYDHKVRIHYSTDCGDGTAWLARR